MQTIPEGAQKLARLLGGLKSHSKFALAQAFQAREIAGLGATIIIQIPTDPNKPADVYFTTAPTQLVCDTWKGRV